MACTAAEKKSQGKYCSNENNSLVGVAKYHMWTNAMWHFNIYKSSVILNQPTSQQITRDHVTVRVTWRHLKWNEGNFLNWTDDCEPVLVSVHTSVTPAGRWTHGTRTAAASTALLCNWFLSDWGRQQRERLLFFPVSPSPSLFLLLFHHSLYVKLQPQKTRTLPCSNKLWERRWRGRGSDGRQKRSRLAAGIQCTDYCFVCIQTHTEYF